MWGATSPVIGPSTTQARGTSTSALRDNCHPVAAMRSPGEGKRLVSTTPKAKETVAATAAPMPAPIGSPMPVGRPITAPVYFAAAVCQMSQNAMTITKEDE